MEHYANITYKAYDYLINSLTPEQRNTFHEINRETRPENIQLVEIQDTLNQRVKDTAEEVVDDFLTNMPDTYDELDELAQEEGIPEDIFDTIISYAASNTPIYTKEIEDTWYLHSCELEQAYENAGIGDNPRENNGMTAIALYIEHEARDIVEEHIENIRELVKDFLDELDEKCPDADTDKLDEECESFVAELQDKYTY